MTPDCRESETAQRYVAGRLPASDLVPFEIHLLTCERCQAEVRLGASIASALHAERAPAPDTVTPAAGTRPAAEARDLSAATVSPVVGAWRRRRFPVIAVPALAAAAAVVLVVGRSRSGLAELEGVVPPVFSGAPSRSTADPSSPVDAAMEAYASRDYRRAAELLERASPSDSSASVAFYLGVARVAIGDARGALRAFAIPRSADGSPYQFDAAVFAAKAHIRLGSADSAVAILRAIPDGAPAARHARALADSIRARLR